MVGGETVIRLFLNITGIPSGVESISIAPMDGFSIFDKIGNAMDASQSIGPITYNDRLAPTIRSADLASNNSYIDLTISEAVYNSSFGSGALEVADFSLTFSQNSGNATAVSITSIKKNDIIYWKGHVALALSNKKLIHAYGPMKKTVVMGINQTIKRIDQTAKLKVIGIKRL